MNLRTGCKVLFVCCLVFCAAAVAQTSPDVEFQLDGQAQKNTSSAWTCGYGTCDYWDLVNQGGSASATGDTPVTPLAHSLGDSTHYQASTFVYGGASTLSFSGGGSKDPNDLTSWSCSSSPTPNKDTLTNAYAASYTDTADLVLVFGADRYSTSGDANIGIWFFGENIHCDSASGKFVQDGGSPAVHGPNDILVVSQFVGGGTVPQIAVYQWDPTHCGKATHNSSPTAGTCADTNLMTKFIGTVACSNGLGGGQSTASSSVGQGACAVTNATNIPVTWPYPFSSSASSGSDSKGNSTWIIPAQAFFTGGLDVTHALGTSSKPCFTSFLVDTRSSQSTSAVLKDFIGGHFGVCSLGVQKACGNGANGANAPAVSGSQIEYQWVATVKNTGYGPLSNITLTDSLSGATISPSGISSLSPGASASFTVTYDTSSGTQANSASATGYSGGVPIHSTTGGGYYATGTDTCNLSVVNTVTVQKHCASPGPSLSCSAGGCVVQYPITAQVCNIGGSQLTGITLSDSQPLFTAFSPNGLTLNAGDCTGSVVTSVACKSSSDCAPGYTCNANGYCVTPPNPAAVFTPTNADVTGSNGTSYFFSDTVSVTGATAALGSSPGSVALCGGAQACSSVSCPLCPTNECSTTAVPYP